MGQKDNKGEKERKKGEAWEKRRWTTILDCLQMAVRVEQRSSNPVRAEAVCEHVCLGVYLFMHPFVFVCLHEVWLAGMCTCV